MSRPARAIQLAEMAAPSQQSANSTGSDKIHTPKVGTLRSVHADGRVFVQWAGQREPVAALIAVDVSKEVLLGAILERMNVLLDFVDGDAEKPVILGLIRSRIDMLDNRRTSFDLEDVTLRAPKNLILQCGESSITLNHTGRLTIRGTEVVSESTGAVKLKGAYVELN